MFRRIKHFACGPDQAKAIHLEEKNLMELPALPDRGKNGRSIRALSREQQERFDCSLDGAVAIGIPKPDGIEEERQLVNKFLAGIQKLFSVRDNWMLLQPLLLSLNYCASCQTCSDACPVFTASGGQEAYRPTYRSDFFRAIVARHVKKGGKWLARITAADADLNWQSIVRLAELCYRCTLCRRCTQICPLGIDNALITHELRKVFSQEMGIAPKEIHQLGTVQQLRIGSSTGMRPKAFEDVKNFMEEEIHEKTGRTISIPVDKKGADILLIHNAGEFISWPENPEAFAIIFEAAGLSWTLSSRLLGYDGVNYGVWYDDFQFTRIAHRHAEVAKELGVSRIVIGECGHSHKASIVMADGLFPADLQIPRESCLPLLQKIVFSGKFKLNPGRNDFPLTLHDPCNITRMMGIVSPQRVKSVFPCKRSLAVTA